VPEDGVGEGEKEDVRDEGAGGGAVADDGDDKEEGRQRMRSTEEASGPDHGGGLETEGIWRARMGRRR
jgi:hypothetical protein